MKDLDPILDQALEGFKNISSASWEHKPSPEKWSRKEILGHLVDSALNNLQRFTEIQNAEGPYQVRPYLQDQLVVANGYQQQPLDMIMDLWHSINRHITYLMQRQTKQDLAMEVITPGGTRTDLQWLMEDYIEHLQHHLNQIFNN